MILNCLLSPTPCWASSHHRSYMLHMIQVVVRHNTYFSGSGYKKYPNSGSLWLKKVKYYSELELSLMELIKRNCNLDLHAWVTFPNILHLCILNLCVTVSSAHIAACVSAVSGYNSTYSCGQWRIISRTVTVSRVVGAANLRTCDRVGLSWTLTPLWLRMHSLKLVCVTQM